MLLAHQITSEFNAVIPEAKREKLKDTAFEDLYREAVSCTTYAFPRAASCRPCQCHDYR
jgi:sucrose synthase